MIYVTNGGNSPFSGFGACSAPPGVVFGRLGWFGLFFPLRFLGRQVGGLAQVATQATITDLFLKLDEQRALGMSAADRQAA